MKQFLVYYPNSKEEIPDDYKSETTRKDQYVPFLRYIRKFIETSVEITDEDLVDIKKISVFICFLIQFLMILKCQIWKVFTKKNY